MEKIDHPSHYNEGYIEAIDVISLFTEEFSFCIGNAIKYLMRAPYKKDAPFEEHLKKANWYIKRAVNSKINEKVYEFYKQKKLSIFEEKMIINHLNIMKKGNDEEKKCADILERIFNVLNGNILYYLESLNFISAKITLISK